VRIFNMLPIWLSKVLKGRLFSIVRAKFVAEEGSVRGAPKLLLARHDRKWLTAECATAPYNLVKMAAVHHIPPFATQRSTRPPALVSTMSCFLFSFARRYFSASGVFVTTEAVTGTSFFGGRPALLASPWKRIAAATALRPIPRSCPPKSG
jgi:hypothetical protein